MDRKDNLTEISLCCAVLGLCIASMLCNVTNKQQEQRIAKLEYQVEALQEENDFLKEHYEEEIVMLDSQLLVLETDLVEMKDGVDLIKK